ncbi:hypothetical protein COY91_04590 [Candidatus Shapirobacteria bacterium CG_4_10_14_0_8_um_filter_39_15]|nr:MAG: hypothetical protein COY91_04590 [Candidatus Shapirobacteria bacterium CG_4_10_14_0_8_um_filter_39_15]
MNCQSCGLPMMIDSDHGGGRIDNPYCHYCTDEAGNLKPKEEIREGMINLYMQSFGKTREEAEKEVDTRMAEMPAWAASIPAPAEPVMPVIQPIAPAPVEPVMETPVVSPAPEPVVPTPLAPEPVVPEPVIPEPVVPVPTPPVTVPDTTNTMS